MILFADNIHLCHDSLLFLLLKGFYSMVWQYPFPPSLFFAIFWLLPFVYVTSFVLSFAFTSLQINQEETHKIWINSHDNNYLMNSQIHKAYSLIVYMST